MSVAAAMDIWTKLEIMGKSRTLGKTRRMGIALIDTLGTPMSENVTFRIKGGSLIICARIRAVPIILSICTHTGRGISSQSNAPIKNSINR